MSNRIFVGNLPWKATEEQLKALFEAYGAVLSVRIITDQFTGKSKGFGFVEMESNEAAQKAIEAIDNKPFMDRNIRVSLAHERTEKKPSAGGDRRGGGGHRKSNNYSSSRMENNYSS